MHAASIGKDAVVPASETARTVSATDAGKNHQRPRRSP
jgi:hypothetical protein